MMISKNYSNRDYKQYWPMVYPHWASAGRNVHAYVFGGGINVRHPEFNNYQPDTHNRAVNFTQDRYSPYTNSAWIDENGEGTFVAGIIGGLTTGVAPNVTIVNVKVQHRGMCSNQAVAKALQDVIDRHSNNRHTTNRSNYR